MFWPGPFFPIFRIWIPKRCKGVHCVDLDESFPTSIYLQNLASIQPRTSPKKFENSSSRKFELKLLNFKALIYSPDRICRINQICQTLLNFASIRCAASLTGLHARAYRSRRLENPGSLLTSLVAQLLSLLFFFIRKYMFFHMHDM